MADNRHEPAAGAHRRARGWLARHGYGSFFEFVVVWFTGPGFLAAAIGLAQYAPPPTWGTAVLACALVALFVLAFRTELTHAYGATVATQPVLFAIALCMPWQYVPLVVAMGTLLALSGTRKPGDSQADVLARWAYGACSVGLAGAAGALGLTWASWSWHGIALAYAAQVVVDAGVGLAHARAQGQPLDEVVAGMKWTYLMDALLGVLGLGIIVIAHGSLPGLLLLGVPILLLWLLSRDRQARYEEAVTLETRYTEAEAQARIDALTGLSNRRVWAEELDAITGEDGAPDPDLVVTVLLADLDHLKVANDTFGHELGDSLLTDFADVLRTCAPRGSTVARLGGDEFGMLVVQTAGSTPPDLVGRVRQGVALRAAARGTDLVTLSASLGQASAPPYPTVDDAVQRADHASRVDKFERRVQRSDTPLDA